MNHELPPAPTDDIESLLTAYLLGELNADDMARVEFELAQNPALQTLKSELEYTMGLVREAVRNPSGSESNPPVSEHPQLSSRRRGALLDTLRQAPVLPLQTEEEPRESKRWMIPMAIAAALVGLLSLHEFSFEPLSRQSAPMPTSNTIAAKNVQFIAPTFATGGQRLKSEGQDAFTFVVHDGMAPSTPSASSEDPRFGKEKTQISAAPNSAPATLGDPLNSAAPSLPPANSVPAEPQAKLGVSGNGAIRGMDSIPRDPALAAIKLTPAAEVDTLQRGSLSERRAGSNSTPAPTAEEPKEAQIDSPSSVTNGPASMGHGSLPSSTPAKVSNSRPVIAAAKSAAADHFGVNEEIVAQRVPPPQPEILTSENAFSTFSLNVSDVSFKLAAASLQAGSLPQPATVRTEEFINAFQYRDPEPASGQPMAFAWDRAASPFAQNRDLLRFSIKTAATGRESGRPLNLVLLLDKSGSMERPDRVAMVREALNSLAGQLKTQDRLSVVTFARTARLLTEAMPSDAERVRELARKISDIPAEGGTNLEEAIKLAYATASKHFLRDGLNRVVLLTDGAANLGEVDPSSLQAMVEIWRQRGIALDCFGVGWEGLNDSLLATMASHGDGRYGLINTPEDAENNFASQLAGALHVAASDVKVQVEFNPQRVSAWRQMGYATHQLTQEQFRDNRVDAAELAAAEAGNALYSIQVKPQGSGPIATVRARFRDPVVNTHRELSWSVPYGGSASSLEGSSTRMRLAATAGYFGEWLSESPHAAEITPTRLLNLLRGVPTSLSPDPRPALLETMLRQAQSLTGK